MRRAKKEFEAQRTKLPTPTKAMDALKEDEEQNGKQKKKLGADPQPSYREPFGRILITCRDHTVFLF